MATFKVNGGKPLQGIYPVSGAKNAAPKILIAALLSNQTCRFANIPQLADTFRSLHALTALGGWVRFVDENIVDINCRELISYEIPQYAQAARQSALFIGATLARLGKVKIHPPKGDAIGKRPLNRHLEGIEALGAKIKQQDNCLVISMPPRPQGMTYRFAKNSHSGTENLILASVFNQSQVILENAAQEPEVDNLIECLNSMGAQIKRVAPRVIKITGVKPLLHGARVEAIPDRLEAVTALTLSVMTGGQVQVANTPRRLLAVYASFLEGIGVELEWQDDLVRIKKIANPLKTANITTSHEPGFMTDWQPLASLLLAHQAAGRSLIHETIFETRWRFLEELKKMGVKYELFQPAGFGPQDYNFNDSEYSAQEPHAAYIHGPTPLQPAEVNSHDVRAGINMLLAALAAPGKSTVYDPHGHIDRGYEHIINKLTNLGADIERK